MKHVKLSDRVYRHLQDAIAQGGWAEGSRIPTEMELAEQYDVSRSVVREALVRLKSEGVIVSRRGYGSVVVRSRFAAETGFQRIRSIADLIEAFEFRLSIECDVAACAAARWDGDQLEKMRIAAEALTGLNNDEAFGDADFNFHLSIAEASGNSMFVATLAMLRHQIIAGMRLASELVAESDAMRSESVEAEHGAIFECIVNRDSGAAHAAMAKHLRSSRFRLLGFEVPTIGVSSSGSRFQAGAPEEPALKTGEM